MFSTATAMNTRIVMRQSITSIFSLHTKNKKARSASAFFLLSSTCAPTVVILSNFKKLMKLKHFLSALEVANEQLVDGGRHASHFVECKFAYRPALV